jgi:protocadherin-15
MIKAEDQGGLTSTARLQIRVSDTNDRNPEFTDLPYVFRVKENDLTGYVGRVQVNFLKLNIRRFFDLNFVKKS